LGLAGPYCKNPLVKRLMRKLMALGFLPLGQFEEVFNALRQRRRTRNLIEQYPNIEDFFTYMERTWMVNGNFTPALWNVNQRVMEYRTNNAVESFHNTWNAAVGVRHPSLWTLLRVMKDQHTIQQNQLRNMRNGIHLSTTSFEVVKGRRKSCQSEGKTRHYPKEG